MHSRSLGIILSLLATALFALHDATSKHLTMVFAVPLVIWARYFVYLTIMTVTIAPSTGREIFMTRRPFLMIVRGLVLVGVSICFQNALLTLPLAEATSLVFVTPLMVALLAGPMLGEKVRLQSWLATVAGFCGVLLIARPGGSMSAVGVAYALGTALCYAAYQLLTRKLSVSEPPMRQLYYTALVGFPAMSCIVPFYWSSQLPTLHQALLILSLGVYAGLGQFFLIRAFRETPASLLSPLLNVQLVWAILLGWLLFNQLPDLLAVAGMLIIGASCLFLARQRPQQTSKGATSAGQ